MRSLLDKITDRFAIDEAPSDCWTWTGDVMTNGYGRYNSAHPEQLAHRLVYVLIVEVIPVGYDIDHLCRNRACVNPDHLEPVTRAENLQRSPLVWARRAQQRTEATMRRALRPNRHNRDKTHCPAGHPYDVENTRIYRGSRRCRACDRERQREKYRRRKGGQR